MSGIKELQKRLKENHERAPADLVINRVPKLTKNRFIEVAKEQFCGDYGMTLKWLVDGLLPETDERVNDLLVIAQDHEDRLKELEVKPVEEPEKKAVKMLDGSKKRIGGIENE